MPNFLIMMLAEETILETVKEKLMTVIITYAKVRYLKDHSKISIFLISGNVILVSTIDALFQR